MPSLRLIISLLGATFLLTSCGGGGPSDFPPIVTSIRVNSAQYSKTATIYVAGRDLRSSIVADTRGICTNPSYASNSSPELMVLNCQISAVGEMPLTLKTAQGSVLYQTTITIPKPQVAMLTSAGTFTMELEPAASPATVRNFLSYISSGYYRSTLFHRVIPGFVVQGGGYTTGMVQKSGQSAPIALETPNGLSNVRATVAMARTSVPDSATSEFFINLVDNSATLDYRSPASPGYAVFGTVVQGMDVIDSIATQPTGAFNGFQDVPLSDVTITFALQVK